MFNIPVQRKQEWIVNFLRKSLFSLILFLLIRKYIISFDTKKYCFAFMVRFLRLREQLCVFLENANFPLQKKKSVSTSAVFRGGVRVISVFSHVTGSVYKRFFTGVDFKWPWIALDWWSSRDFNDIFYITADIRTSNNLVWVLEFNSFITPVTALLTLPLIKVLPTTFLRQAF